MSIFIGGYARTGTTLMQGIVCSDETVFPATREASYFRGLVAAYRNGLHHWDVHTGDYFDSKEAFRDFHRALLERYFAHLHRRGDTDREIVQKDPTLTMFFPEILELVPDSRFIVMTRDPRDTIASQLRRAEKSGLDLPRNVGSLMKEYVKLYQAVAGRKQDFADRLLYVRYEELVRDPGPVLDELRRFLGLEIPFDPAGGWDTKRRADEESGSLLDGRAISSARVGAYREVLTPGEIQLIGQVADQVNRMFGFDVYLAEPRDDAARG